MADRTVMDVVRLAFCRHVGPGRLAGRSFRPPLPGSDVDAWFGRLCRRLSVPPFRLAPRGSRVGGGRHGGGRRSGTCVRQLAHSVPGRVGRAQGASATAQTAATAVAALGAGAGFSRRVPGRRSCGASGGDRRRRWRFCRGAGEACPAGETAPSSRVAARSGSSHRRGRSPIRRRSAGLRWRPAERGAACALS